MKINADLTDASDQYSLVAANGITNQGVSSLMSMRVVQEANGVSLSQKLWVVRPFTNIEFNEGIPAAIDTSNTPPEGWVRLDSTGDYLVTVHALYGNNAGHNIVRLRDESFNVYFLTTPGIIDDIPSGGSYNSNCILSHTEKITISSSGTKLYLEHWAEDIAATNSGGISISGTFSSGNVMTIMDIIKFV